MENFYIKKIREFNFNTSKNIAIVGMPGIANVGKNVILTAVDSLNADKICEIHYNDFPAQVITDKRGLLSTPSANIFASEAVKKDHSVFLITGDFQPSTPQGIYEFSFKISELLKELNVDTVISTGAYVTNAVIGEPKVFISGTSTQIINKFLRFEKTVLMESGTISGANGLIPIISQKRFNLVGVCLLAETNPMAIVDPSASKAIVELLNLVYKLDIKLDKLDKQIKQMEELLNKLKDEYSKKKPRSDKYQPYIS
ncbi:MAG: PAC2 family protein [Candidatus Odinarchaeia archaeon]